MVHLPVVVMAVFWIPGDLRGRTVVLEGSIDGNPWMCCRLLVRSRGERCREVERNSDRRQSVIAHTACAALCCGHEVVAGIASISIVVWHEWHLSFALLVGQEQP